MIISRTDCMLSYTHIYLCQNTHLIDKNSNILADKSLQPCGMSEPEVLTRTFQQFKHTIDQKVEHFTLTGMEANYYLDLKMSNSSRTQHV